MLPKPCPKGRLEAASMASMNLRAVVGRVRLVYVAPPPRRLALVKIGVGPRFQPRDECGRFVSYADLLSAVNLDFAMTQYAEDQIDEMDASLDWD